MTGLYQAVFESVMNKRRKIDLHFSPQDRFSQRTARLDFGRQTGKTTAIVRLMSDNHQYDYIVLSHSTHGANLLAEQYKRIEAERIKYQENTVQLTGNQLSQIEKTYANWVLTKSKRKLCIIVEEPMKSTNRILDNLYDILASTEIDYQIFVVGCQ